MANFNPVLQDDFFIGAALRLSGVKKLQYIFSKALNSLATTQIALRLNADSDLELVLEGNVIPVAYALDPAGTYKILVVREAGMIYTTINEVDCSTVFGDYDLTERPNVRIGGISSSVDGSTQTDFFNGSIFALSTGQVFNRAAVKRVFHSWALTQLGTHANGAFSAVRTALI